MRWPPWRRPDPEQQKAREEARQVLEETLANWINVYEAVEPIERGMVKNHLIQKAFVMREKGDR